MQDIIGYLVLQLFERDPTRRLGVTGNIRAHPFFKTINWTTLEKREVDPPFKPKVVCRWFFVSWQYSKCPYRSHGWFLLTCFKHFYCSFSWNLKCFPVWNLPFKTAFLYNLRKPIYHYRSLQEKSFIVLKSTLLKSWDQWRSECFPCLDVSTTASTAELFSAVLPSWQRTN